MWFFKKKSADQEIRDLVENLSRALGNNLVSVVLYGSKASGEYRERKSNINLFLLIEDVSWDSLRRMASVIGQWTKAGHPVPVFVQKNELPFYANSLPVEFLDMQDHHKVLYGIDPLQGLKVDRAHLRAQCAEELSVKQLKLRQAILLAGGNEKRLRQVLEGSLPSLLTLYRAVLRLEAEVPPGQKIVAAKELARRVGFDGDCLERLWDTHMRRETDQMADLARSYLEGIERVIAYVAKRQNI